MNLRALGVVVCVLVFTQNLREVSPSGNSQVPSVAALLTERIIVFPEVVDSGGYSTQLVLIGAMEDRSQEAYNSFRGMDSRSGC